MLIYAVADIHGAQFRINEVYELIKEYRPDVTCICGDITQFGPGDVAINLLNQLLGIVYVVTGNIDTQDVYEGIANSNAENIEGKRVVQKGVSFLGMNGVSDHQSSVFYKNQNNLDLFRDLDVLVTHVPPFGYQDTVFLGKHGGSKILTKIIKETKPRLVLSGHIHEQPGYTKCSDSIIVNCSMGKRGKGAIIDFGTKISVTMID